MQSDGSGRNVEQETPEGACCFRLLTPQEVVERWAELRERLAPAVEQGRGEVEVDDLRKLVLQCRLYVFVLERDGAALMAVTAEFAIYPRQAVMVIGFGAGKGGRKHAALIGSTLRDFAHKAGACRIVTYVQSPAMARYHALVFGATPAYTVMEFKC